MTAPDVRAILADALTREYGGDPTDYIGVAGSLVAALEAAGLVICVKEPR